MHKLTETFTEALHALHIDRDVDPMTSLFSNDTTLSKLGTEHTERGPAGTRSFWLNYREAFDEVEASFTHVTEGSDRVALEWTSRGTLTQGEPFEYDGVSILDADGDSIGAFRTYYDSAAFVRKRAQP